MRERVAETRTMRLRMGKLSAGSDFDDNDGDGDGDDEGGNDDMPSYGEMVLKISFKCECVIS